MFFKMTRKYKSLSGSTQHNSKTKLTAQKKYRKYLFPATIANSRIIAFLLYARNMHATFAIDLTRVWLATIALHYLSQQPQTVVCDSPSPTSANGVVMRVPIPAPEEHVKHKGDN